MNEPQVAHILSILHGAYPNQHIDDAMTDTWANVLATCDHDLAEVAVRRWVEDSHWWPKPAELNAVIREIANERRDGGEWTPPPTKVRCDGSRWIDRGDGPEPCPACNPWQRELFETGRDRGFRPKPPKGFIMPPPCAGAHHGDGSMVVPHSRRAMQMVLAGYREAKREQGMDEPDIDDRINERYRTIQAYVSQVADPAPQ